MSTLATRAHSPLEWTQPSAMRSEYVLESLGQPVGSLVFRSSFGTLASAGIDGQRWTFKRVGFWQQKVSVRAEGSEADLAEFQNNTWHDGGELRFPDGRTYRASSNFWATKLEWWDSTDMLVARFEHGGLLRLHSTITIPAGTAPGTPIDLLVALGLYLVIMLHRDSSTVAAVGAVS